MHTQLTSKLFCVCVWEREFEFTIDTVIMFALYDVKITLLLPIIHFNLPAKSIIANIISIESAPNTHTRPRSGLSMSGVSAHLKTKNSLNFIDFD